MTRSISVWLLVLWAACGQVENQSAELAARPASSLHYDQHGIPHVIANSSAEAAFALGFQQMRDFPVQTPWNLLSASARLSERIGPGRSFSSLEHPFHIARDLVSLKWRIPERGAQHWQRIQQHHPKLAKMITRFAEGINKRREQWLNSGAYVSLAHNTEIDLTATQIERLLDVKINEEMVVTLSLFWSSSNAMLVTANALGLNEPLIVPFTASNSWAVNKNGSATGYPMLSSSPHLPSLSSEFRSYFVTLHAPDLKVGGWLNPGMPLPSLAFTPDLSWGVVASGSRPSAAWRADLDTPDSYLVSGERRYISRDVAEIAVWGEPSRQFELAWADGDERDMPILYQNDQQIGFAGGTITSTSETLLEFQLRLAESKSVQDMEDAMRRLTFTQGAFIAVDRQGNLRSWQNARVAVRHPKDPDPGAVLRNGNKAEELWDDDVVHPYDDLPIQRLDHAPGGPGEVWINNNVMPQFVRENGHVEPKPYWSYMAIGLDAPTRRNVRAREIMVPPVSFATFEAATVDVFDTWSRDTLPYLRRAVGFLQDNSLIAADPVRDFAMDWIDAWDHQATKYSHEAAFVQLWRGSYRKLANDITLEFNDFAFAFALPLPPLATFPANKTEQVDAWMLGVAFDEAIRLYTSVNNVAMLQNVSYPDPWSTCGPFVPPAPLGQPWAALAQAADPYLAARGLPQLGHLHILMSDVLAGGQSARPVGGAKNALFNPVNGDLSNTIYETSAPIPGLEAFLPLGWYRNGGSSGRTFIVELRPDGPRAKVTTPIGATEILDDCRRYLPSQPYADRQMLDLPFSPEDVLASARQTIIP